MGIYLLTAPIMILSTCAHMRCQSRPLYQYQDLMVVIPYRWYVNASYCLAAIPYLMNCSSQDVANKSWREYSDALSLSVQPLAHNIRIIAMQSMASDSFSRPNTEAQQLLREVW